MFAIRIMDQAGALARRHEIPRTFPRVALCLSEPQTPRPDQLCGYLWVQALKTASSIIYELANSQIYALSFVQQSVFRPLWKMQNERASHQTVTSCARTSVDTHTHFLSGLLLCPFSPSSLFRLCLCFCLLRFCHSTTEVRRAFRLPNNCVCMGAHRSTGNKYLHFSSPKTGERCS